MIIKALAMKCRWQIQKFQPYADKIICFIDEPILSAFGSSTYVSVKRTDVVDHLTEVVAAVHADNALAGVHCCGNTEWSILIDAGVDIVNFDAFQYGETIAMYPAGIKSLFARGGCLAWGVVPTSPAIREQSVASLITQLEKVMDHLASKGIDKQLIAEQAIITPSCGTGSMEPADAERVFDRFWRSPSARNAPGSGLGLSIVAQTIKSHGGWVKAGHSAEGGAEFIIRLPGQATPPGEEEDEDESTVLLPKIKS